MNPFARIRPRPFLAFGLIATFALVGAQQTASTPAKCPMDELMENAECFVTTVTERGNRFYADNPELNRETHPVLEKAEGPLTSINGKRVLNLVVRGTRADGETYSKDSLFEWEGKKGAMRVWFKVGDKKRTERIERDLKRDPTLDPTNWSYRILGSTLQELTANPEVKTYPDGELMVIEGPLRNLSLKAWYNPKHSNLFEKIELKTATQDKTRLVRVTKSEVHQGIYLPLEIIEENFATVRKNPDLLSRTKTSLTSWKFGKLRESLQRP